MNPPPVPQEPRPWSHAILSSKPEVPSLTPATLRELACCAEANIVKCSGVIDEDTSAERGVRPSQGSRWFMFRAGLSRHHLPEQRNQASNTRDGPCEQVSSVCNKPTTLTRDRKRPTAHVDANICWAVGSGKTFLTSSSPSATTISGQAGCMHM